MADTDLGSFVQGTTLSLTAAFTNSTDGAVDPTAITLHIEEAGNVETTAFKVNCGNPAVGSYTYEHGFDIIGKFEGSWLGVSTGSDSSVAENFKGIIRERD